MVIIMKRTIRLKFLSVVLCVLMLFTAVSCNLLSEKEAPKTYDEQKELYADIISQYSDLLADKHSGKKLTEVKTDGMDKREAEIAKTLYAIVDTCKDEKAAELMSYGYKDFDGNGTPELVLVSHYANIRALFTLFDDEPILLASNYVSGDSFWFASNNRFFIVRSNVNGNIQEVTYYTCRVSGDKLVNDDVCGQTYDQEKREVLGKFQIIDGKRISINDDEFRALNLEYQKSYMTVVTTDFKREAPYLYYPLSDKDADNDLPVAYFSDYGTICKTYQKISTCIDEFKLTRWAYGVYDDLFSFPDDRSYEYYIRLLYAAYQGSTEVGYDEIDLNGDGQDELVLLNEDYRIKAIFTQKDGQPVLVDAFGYETCWIDDQGFIHVDLEDDDKLVYSLYEFTKKGEYKLHYSIFVDNFGRYIIKDGKTAPLDFEESLTLYYDEYCRYSEPFAPNEQTRNVTDLTFTPFGKADEDIIKDGWGKTWRKYGDLEKTSGKEMAVGITYITFENITETQVSVNFKYEFIYYYPDPNKENTLLDDVTESQLSVTGKIENGVITFDENGIKGKIEIGDQYTWLIIEESSDDRFFVGNHCCKDYSSSEIIS